MKHTVKMVKGVNTEAEITFQSAWNVVQKFGEKLEEEEAFCIYREKTIRST